jgi:methyl-accepting chemotaxis protein-1 (serine sensor receptor)
MSISRLVFLALALVGGIAFYKSSEALLTSHMQVQRDLQLQKLAEIKSEWLEGTVAMSFERSVTQVALSLDDPAPQAFLDLIDEQRRRSDVHLNKAIDVLSQVAATENFTNFLNRAAAGRDVVAEIRVEVDALLRQPKSARPSDRARDLPYKIKKEIEKLYATSEYLRRADGSSSSYESFLKTIQARAYRSDG